ncbi:MAG: rhodanese-like domain-containing protein [Alphaproteobacteria bacterium]
MFNALNCEIDIQTLERLGANGDDVKIIDVREPWEREICMLSGSIGIPLAELAERLDELPEAGTLVLLCHHGVRSLQAATWLRRQGFEHAVSLQGGIDAWASEVEPGMRRY